MRRKLETAVLIFVWAVGLAGCQQSESPAPVAGVDGPNSPVGSKPETVARSAQQELALAAKKDLFEALSSRLMAVLSEGTPADAISVCSEEAREIAQRVAAEHGVAIGRTSFRLRNPKNVPPLWAEQLVEDRAADPRFVDLEEGQLGALLPIRLKPTCLICHGPSEQIPELVKQRLASLYPDDQATGFEADELRGWFWVEVPPG